MICPSCHSDHCRRSQRRGFGEHLLGLTGLRSWRCGICKLRFFGWSVPVNYAGYAHCKMCGSLDLQRISREHVDTGHFRLLWRLLQVPAYRCPPCRHKFFSLLSYHRIAVQHYETFGSGTQPASH